MARRMMVLHSALAPEAVAEALRREVGEARWSVSPLARMGEAAFVGKVGGGGFYLRTRGYRGDNFASQFYGRVEAEPGEPGGGTTPGTGGTRIVGYFDFPRWIRWLMWVWLVLAVGIAVPIFVVTVVEIWRDPQVLSESRWAGVVVPPCFLTYALLLPLMGRRFGGRGERVVLRFLETKLGARVEGAPS